MSGLLRSSFVLAISLWIGTLPCLHGQYLGGIHTLHEDDYREWVIRDDEGRSIGQLKMRWRLQNDITFWDYTIGDHRGEIRARWRDNFSEWEVNGDDMIVTLRQIWRDIPTEWRITDDRNTTLNWVTRWGNTPEEWELREFSTYGRFETFTVWEGDPRDWVILDDCGDSLALPFKMGLVFLPILYHLPK